LTWEAVRRESAGGVWALAADERTAEALRGQSGNLETLSRPVIIRGTLGDLPDLLAAHEQGEVRFDVVLGRNALTRHTGKVAAAQIIASLLADGGRLSLAEVVPRHGQRLYQLIDLSSLGEALSHRLVAAEEAIYSNPDDSMVNWDAADLRAALRAAGLSDVQVQVETVTTQQHLGAEHLARWFGASPDRQRPSYAQHLRRYLSDDEFTQAQALFEGQLRDQPVAWTSQVVYLSARR